MLQRSRVFLHWLLLLGLWQLAIPSAVRGELRIPPAAMANAEVDRVLQLGDQLEHERRWGEALAHYEEALRDHPHQPQLQQRLARARTHYDVARRYSDSSFIRSVHKVTPQESLDLYGEVLLKIQTHYVHEPHWAELVQRGVMSLEIASFEPAFVQQHAVGASPDQLQAFRGELHRQLDGRIVRDRHEARQLAELAASLAAQSLNVPPQAAILEFTCGAAGALDPYSTFLTADQLNEVFSQIEGNFVGLGLELKSDQEALLIVSVIPDGPADRVGIRPGDRIVEVDGKTTREVSADTAADMLKGAENTMVQVAIIDAQGQRHSLQMTRQRVEVPSIEGESIVDAGSGVAYLRLSSFQKTTSRDMDRALWSLHRQGMRFLIMDLRGNPGGLLTAAVEVADKFISGGTIVSTRGRSAREDYDYRAHAAGTWRVPLVVLIDRDSASASEIFAAAIRDHRRGVVVGQRSYGKGSVQGIFPLNTARSGVRLTTAKFYSPSGQPISQRGVDPNVNVPLPAPSEDAHLTARPDAQGRIPVPDPEDVVLKAALQVIQNQLSQR